jgi:DNA-binding PadR family transcriptional regulator
MRMCGRQRGAGGGPRFMHGFGRHGGDHEGGGRFGRGGGGMRGGRFFDSGDLKLVMLQLISDRPRHGYELIKEIEDRLSGAYSPSPGVVYPTLTMLEDIGYATVSAEAGGKKLYAITEEGKAFLATNRPAIEAIFGRMGEAALAQGGALPQVMRAMHNLRLALKMRLSRGNLSEEQVRRIVDAIDAAAVEVERS